MTIAGSKRDEPYPPGAIVGAAVATLVAPFISLLFALVLLSNATQPRRSAQLKTWAIASGVVLAIGAVIFLIVVGSFLV
jgi:Na+-driven multidrug efflux pump